MAKKNAKKKHAEVATPEPRPTDLVADGKRWTKVSKPRPWKPTRVGETLVGVYMGRQQKEGAYGHYQQATLSTDTGIWYLSGTVIINLLDGVPVPLVNGETILRVVFRGLKETAKSDFTYRDFDLYVETATIPKP